MPGPRFFIMRHGETIFNAARRLQGDFIHTPLTRLGIEQALAMGVALRGALGPAPTATLHASDTGRAQQTLALVCDVLGLDPFAARIDPALREIGMGSWGGRAYDAIAAEYGPIVDAEHLLAPAPDGEDYPAIARRLRPWLAAAKARPGDHIVVMHGISSRVLRGLMTGLADHPRHRAPIAAGLTQGSVAVIEHGTERVLHGAVHGGLHA